MDETPSPPSTVPVQHHTDTFQQLPSKCTLHTYGTLEAEEEDMEEDFQTVPLDNEHWDMEDICNRTLCVHEHALPHGLCPYPCPYANYQTSSYYCEGTDMYGWYIVLCLFPDNSDSPL